MKIAPNTVTGFCVALPLALGAVALARPTAPTDATDAAVYAIDSTHSSVLFKVSHFQSTQ